MTEKIIANKLISIVLPSYNGVKYIRQSINSILLQSYESWELILVDDCSTDITWQIMQEYEEKNPDKIRVIHHEVNRKLPAALNTGFLVARGEYLSWTSDDNCYKPGAFETMASYLDENPNVGLVYCDYSTINDQGELNRVSVLPSEAIMFKSMIGPCFLYRREVYKSVGVYSEKYFLAEDYEFFLRVAEKYIINPLHKDLYFYRLHDASLTSKKANEVMQALDEIKLKYAHKLPYKISVTAKLEGYQKIFRRCIKRKDIKGTFRAYIHLIHLDPKKFYELKQLLKVVLNKMVS